MTAKQEQAARMLDVPPADFFSFTEDTQRRLQGALNALTRSDGVRVPGRTEAVPEQPILALGAPKRVSIDAQNVVPLLVGQVQWGLRAWQVNYRPNLHLFVKDLETGELWIAQPLVDTRGGEVHLLSGGGEPPDDRHRRSSESSVTCVDLQKELEGRMKPGRFLVTAAAYDVLSNSVGIHLESGAEPERTAVTAVPRPYATHVLEKTVELETKVEVPEKVSADGTGSIGIAIQVCEDSGVYRVESGEAFWTCNLILVRLDERPDVVPASVPVQEITTADGTLAFNAAFRIDLAAITAARDAGLYQVYLDAGREVLGPYPLTVPGQ